MSFVANFSAANSSLESLTRNYSAKSYREEVKDGRRYIVSPMTMIVPGVLNGSKGRLFYPEDEVGKDPTPWNGMPITHYHPSVDGKPVSANHERAKAQHIGFVSKSTSLGKLKAEAWVEIEKADKRDPRIVSNIKAGIPMEISTGLYTDNYPAPQGSKYNGKPYDYIARNYRPDHLAILPDQKGACSLNDGCGLGINQEPVDNDWTEWNKTHRKGGGFPIKGKKATPKSNPTQAKMEHHLAKQKEHAHAAVAAKKAGNHSLAKQHAKQSESHANEIHSLRASIKTPGGSDPKALARAKKSKAAFDRRDPALAKSKATKAQKELSKAKQVHTHTKRAVSLATRHAAAKADQHKNASALLRAHLDAAKLHTKHGDSKNAGKAMEKAKKAVIDYSKKRASQHEKVAAAFAKAGDHKMAAHYKARADFHHAHIAKVSKKTPATNAEWMPRGEREFVMNQLEAKKTEMAQVTKKPGNRGFQRMLNETTNKPYMYRYFLTDNALSHEVLRDKLDKALRSKLTQNDPQPYIHEVHDDHIKYDHGGQMKKCNYKVTDNDDVKMGKPKDLKRVVTYEEAEPDGDEPEMNQLTEDGIEPSTNSTRKGGNMAKLTANQRTATIDKLTSNKGCGCFNEEDKDYLAGLSDERLQKLQENHAKHTQNADPEDDDEDEPEGQVQSHNQEKPVTKRMTINEFRETAPLEYLEAVDHAARITNAEKAKIITKLTAHLKDGEVKTRLTANLSKQSLENLEDQLLLIPEAPKPASPATRTVFGPTGNAIVTDDPVSNEENDVMSMVCPRIDYVALSKENAAAHRRN